MTTTLDRRPVKRETNTIDDTRGGRKPFVILLEQGGRMLAIRPKGTKKWYRVDYKTIWRAAVAIRRQEIIAERKAKRAAR